jgi:hypothetical protein
VLITVAAPLQAAIAGLADQRQTTISWRRIIDTILREAAPAMAMVAGFTPEHRVR